MCISNLRYDSFIIFVSLAIKHSISLVCLSVHFYLQILIPSGFSIASRLFILFGLFKLSGLFNLSGLFIPSEIHSVRIIHSVQLIYSVRIIHSYYIWFINSIRIVPSVLIFVVCTSPFKFVCF